MTRNQIDYWRYKEDVRHNTVTEKEMNRHNLSTENLGWSNLRYNYDSLAETIRHNKTGEDLAFKNYSESRRHNMATESNQLLSIAEERRHNRVSERDNRNISAAKLENDYNIARTNQLNQRVIAQMNNAAALERTHSVNLTNYVMAKVNERTQDKNRRSNEFLATTRMGVDTLNNNVTNLTNLARSLVGVIDIL